MRFVLSPHSDSDGSSVRRIEVKARRPSPLQLRLKYEIAGEIDALRVPPLAKPARADELWRTTCLEAFVQIDGEAGYFEFNFAPSRQWAAYVFDAYRADMHAVEIEPPRIEVQSGAARLALAVSVDLPPSAAHADWRLGVTAVIEDVKGEKTYWALAHPPGKPDFHHPIGFAGRLAAEHT
ncbi:MAG: DOMON-like domain-containing protein [Pseudomonadota bacterium]